MALETPIVLPLSLLIGRAVLEGFTRMLISRYVTDVLTDVIGSRGQIKSR